MILLQTQRRDFNTCSLETDNSAQGANSRQCSSNKPLNAVGFTHYFSSRLRDRLERKCSLIKIGIVYKKKFYS